MWPKSTLFQYCVTAFAALALPSVAVAQTAGPEVVFTKDVVPILQRSCQACHRPGSIAPMSLMSYDDARPWGASIKRRVAAREMPPWFIEKNIGVQKFKEDISLTDDEITTIVKWVDGGALRGKDADMPAPRQFPDSSKWSLSRPPDVLVKSDKVTIAASGPDRWYDFAPKDTGLTEDRYFYAVEMRPSPKGQKVFHHGGASMHFPPAPRADAADDAGGGDSAGSGGTFLMEYSIGKNADISPEGTGRLIKAGSKVSFSSHYHSSGEEIVDQLEVALWLYPEGYVPKTVASFLSTGFTYGNLDLPAGESNTRADGYLVLQKAARVTSFQPHMHSRGRRQCLEAILPNGWIETLSCARTFFYWGGRTYTYADDVTPVLPAGTIMHLISWFDSSPGNRENLDSKNWAGFGQRTVDEMSFAWVGYVYLTDEQYKAEKSKQTTQQQ